MRLTLEEHPEAIKRYAHLKPVRRIRSHACLAGLAGTGRTCTREIGHRGPHVAHGRFGKVLAVWDSGPSSTSSKARRRAEEGRVRAGGGSQRRQLDRRRPVGLTDQSAHDLAERALQGLVRLLKSPDELAFVALFIFFVYWGIQWMLMIFR